MRISAKHLDPVAAGILDAGAGLSLLADADLHATSDGQTLNTSGTIRAQNLKLKPGATAASKPLDLTYRGTFRLKENAGQIEDASVKIGNAAIHVNGTYKSNAQDAEDPLLNLKLAGQSLPIDELQPLISAAAVRFPNGSVLKGGTLSMNMAITGHAKSAVIIGPIALDNVSLVGFDVGSKIHGIAALGGVKTGDTTKFQKLNVNVHITDAGVVADNVEAVIEGMGELSGSGTVSPADQLEMCIRDRFTADGGARKREPVTAGRVCVDSGSLEEIEDVVIRDRRHLAEDGVVVPIIAIDKHTGRMETAPEIVTRGFLPNEDGAELLARAREVILRTVEQSTQEEKTDWNVIKEKIRADLKRFLNKQTSKRPLILPVILEV